jgi:hypothetical protein
VVTIGSPLKGSFTWPAVVVQPTTYANGTLSNPAAPLVSPVDGAVIRWRLSEGFFGGPFRSSSSGRVARRTGEEARSALP